MFKYLWSLGLLAFVIFAGATVAVAQEVLSNEPLIYDQCAGFWCEVLSKFPELNAWLVVLFTCIGLCLRGVAELVSFIGQQLKHKSASDWGKKIGSWASWSAQVVGWFGGGTPRAVLLKHVEKEIERTKPEIKQSADK